MFASSHSLTALFMLHQETVLTTILLLHWLCLCCLRSLTDGFYQRSLFQTIYAWSLIAAYGVLVLYPLYGRLHVFKVVTAWLDLILRRTVSAVFTRCKTHEDAHVDDVQVSSNKMLRHMRKKDRRKAARAGKGSANLHPSGPPEPGHEPPPRASPSPEPGKAPIVKTPIHSTTDSKGMSAAPASTPPPAQSLSGLPPRDPCHPTVTDVIESQEGHQTAPGKNATHTNGHSKAATESKNASSDSAVPSMPKAAPTVLTPPSHPQTHNSSGANQSQEGRQPASDNKAGGQKVGAKKATQGKIPSGGSTDCPSAAPTDDQPPPRLSYPPTNGPKIQEGGQPASGNKAGGKKVEGKTATRDKMPSGGPTDCPRKAPSGAQPPPLPNPKPNAVPESQEGWQRVPTKKARGKKAATKKASDTRRSSRGATLQPTATSTSSKAAAVPSTKSGSSISKGVPAAQGAAASRQHMDPFTRPASQSPSTRPVPRAPTAIPGFAASDRPLDPMGDDSVLVGPRLSVKHLIDKLELMPQAQTNLKSASAGISAYRPVRGDGNCGYRAVMAGLIGSSQSSGHLKAHLLQRLPQVFSMISSWGFIQGLGTVYRSDLLSGYNLLKEAVTNSQKVPIETLLGICREQKASDQMLLFVRAICAAGLMLEPAINHEYMQAVLAADRFPCCGWSLEQCLVHCVLPLGGKNIVRWYDDLSSKGLVTALRIGIQLVDVSPNKEAPLKLNYPDAIAESRIALKIVQYGVHYDLCY